MAPRMSFLFDSGGSNTGQLTVARAGGGHRARLSGRAVFFLTHATVGKHLDYQERGNFPLAASLYHLF